MNAGMLKTREAKEGFGDDVPEQVLGRQPYRSSDERRINHEDASQARLPGID